jgi:preprotein translocase subunit SecD
MLKIPLWKWLLAFGPVVAALVFLLTPRERPGGGSIPLNVNLGLDLRGGVHMVMQVQTDDAVKTEVDAAEGRLRHALQEATIPFDRIDRPAVDELRLQGVPPASASGLEKVLEDQLPDWRITTPPAGGYVVSMGSAQEANLREQAVTDVLGGIRERVDKWGIAEPNIQRQGIQGSDRILVQLPGVEDPARVRDLITEPAFLEWKMLVYPPGQPPGNFGGAASADQLRGMFGGTMPDGAAIYTQTVSQGGGKELKTYWPLEKISSITGNDLEDAQRTNDEFGKPAVSFRLKPQAGQRFGKLTRENVGRQMAILLDERVISAPRIESEIPGGHGIITGHFNTREAEDLAFKLRSGALRAGVKIIEERNVGPSLGADSIHKGLVAGWIAFGVVALFMIGWYHWSGVNAVFVLILNLILILGTMAAFGATLTLPGIAGYILTVGMAVDANVLIFERMREELRLGKTVRSAVDGGFDRAWSAIFDSNLTTLISALALFAYGTGPIKGFAVTLSVGLIWNMVTAVFVSRVLFDFFLSRRPRAARLSV